MIKNDLEFQKNSSQMGKEKMEGLTRKIEFLESELSDWRQRAEKAETEKEQVEAEQ